MIKLLPLLALFIPFFSFQQQDKHSSITVENIWKQYQFSGQQVDGFRSMNDGTHYTRFLPVDGQKSIVKYAFENRTDEGDVILNGDAIQFNGKKLYVDSYEFNDDETKILLTVNRRKKYRRSFTANYYLYDLDQETLSPLDTLHVPQTLASYSPDGDKVAYIHKNNLYVKDIASQEVTAITTDGEMNKIINGTTDWVYEEEFAYTMAYDWSPNSEYLAFLKFNEDKVREFTMMYYRDLYPSPYTFKYPKAGEDNSDVTLEVANIKENKTTSIDLGEYEYIPRIKFSSSVNKLMALTMNRHQDDLKYHWIDVTKKEMKDEIVYEETNDTYIEIDDNLFFLEDGKHFIRTSEKSGYNHIYKIGIDGSSTPITKGNWDVIEFKGINEKTGMVYYTSAEEGAPYKALYSIKLNGRKKRKISQHKGSNEATFSTGMKYFVNDFSTINKPHIYTLHEASGDILDTLQSNKMLQNRLRKFNFQKKEFIRIQGAEKELNAWILKPPNFDSTKQYPVYFNIYGGPGSNTVTDSYSWGKGSYHQLLAQKGYIVMSVDPRGTMYRGAAFKKSTYLQLGKLETEDLIAVAKNVGAWDFVDANRIGIMGWSYGGYMTSLAMTKGADYFKMGIAVAPVTNWRYYDNIYTERFMRTPQENADGYDDNSPINHVNKLKGNYLLIHGSGDDNVHIQNTYEMVSALVQADKDFDLFIYPNKSHGIYGGNTRNHLFRKMLNYTLENL